MDEKSAAAPRWGLMRGRRAMLACGLLGAAVFVSFLFASFPYGDTVSSLLAPYKLKLTYQSQRLSPPIGAKLTNVSLFSTAGTSDQALLRSPAVTLAPTLASLLLGQPGLHVSANLYGGIVRVTIRRRGGAMELNFSLDSLDLTQSAPLKMFGAILNGSVSGTGTARINGPNLPDDRAMMAIAGKDLAVSIVNGFPPIHLGTLSGNLELEEGSLKLSGIVAHGADLDLKAEGTIQLGETPDDTSVDLTVYLNPTQNGRDHFGLFLKLLPHPPGPDAPYSVEGDMLSPSIS